MNGPISQGYHFSVGERDEFGELVLYDGLEEWETDAGYVPFSQLSKAQQDELRTIYSEEDIAKMDQPPRWITVPNVIGMSEAQAVQTLKSRGMIVRVGHQYSEDTPDGTCFYQDAIPGKRWRTDASFSIWIADLGEPNYAATRAPEPIGPIPTSVILPEPLPPPATIIPPNVTPPPTPEPIEPADDQDG